MKQFLGLMMKRPSIIVLLMLISVSYSDTNASGGVRWPRHIWYLNGSFAAPIRPAAFKAGWEGSPGFGIGLGHVLTKQATLIGHFNYNRFKYTGQTSAYEDGDLTMLSFSAGLKVKYPKAGGIYTSGGFGYFVLYSDNALEASPWPERAAKMIYESDLALFVGIGLDIRVSSSVSFFVEARYASCLSEGVSTHYIPFGLGISYDFRGHNMEAPR